MDFLRFCVLCAYFTCLFSVVQNRNISLETFYKLSEIHQKWLQFTSVPEAARLLQLPPYSYFPRDSSVGETKVSNILSNQNKLFDRSDDDSDGRCSEDILEIISNIDSSWALQMLDSDGKLSSGILRGGLIWPGHFHECHDVHAPEDKDGRGGFNGQYCVSSWSLNLGEEFPNLPLAVGLCIPDSCYDKNIETTIRNASHILSRYPVLKELESYITLKNVTCKDKTKSLDIASIIYLTVIAGFVFTTFLGSGLAVYNKKISQHSQEVVACGVKAESYHEVTIQVEKTANDETTQVERTASAEIQSAAKSTHKLSDVSLEAEFTTNDNSQLTTHTHGTNVKHDAVNKDSTFKQILLCFDVFSNGEKVLNTQSAEGQLLTIHGVRFLSLTWVIMGHTYISSVSMIGNKIDVLKDMDNFAFQMLLQAPFSVDSFFLLGGFLLAYLFLREADKKNGKVNWVHFYVHRLWRLTPAYLVIVFFYMLIFKYLGSGPFWKDDNCDADRSSWWKYLLYINNFIPINDMCVGWSWYLANDMQFYIISPLFLYPLWRWPKAGFAVLGSMLLTTWAVTGALSYKYSLIPMFVGVTHTRDFDAYEKKMWDSFDLIYDKPYCRIAPYIIGVAMGYFLHKTANRKNFLSWWQQVLGWMVAAFCSLSVVFGLYHVEMGNVESMFYNSLCRSSFVIGLAWLIFACETGHGGFLTKFLSWKLWIPLSRLTYCAYLIHPMFIHGYYQAYQTAIHFTELFAVTNFLGFLVISYGLAFMFSLVFESPLMNLEKLLVKQKKS